MPKKDVEGVNFPDRPGFIIGDYMLSDVSRGVILISHSSGRQQYTDKAKLVSCIEKYYNKDAERTEG